MKTTFVAAVLIIGVASYSQAYAAKAFVDIQDTALNSKISGKVFFEDSKEGLKIKAEIHNAPAGFHGFHVHENGSCADFGKAAGGHFNPDSVHHGSLIKDGFSHAHAGDLGNIEVNGAGDGHLEAIIPHLSLQNGKYRVLGKAVILHEKEDDFSQPVGNAGGRIGCGVIQSQD